MTRTLRSARRYCRKLSFYAYGSDPEAFRFVLERIVEDPDASVRAALCRVLGRSWKTRADVREFLQVRAEADPDASVRAAALTAIARD